MGVSGVHDFPTKGSRASLASLGIIVLILATSCPNSFVATCIRLGSHAGPIQEEAGYRPVWSSCEISHRQTLT
jgi:hypothetical protein